MTKTEELLHLYAGLMEAIKIRISAIDAGTLGRLPLPAQIIREFCFLQIRLICELLALACLVAHGDLERASRLRNEWSAERIMGELEKLHPDFFPYSVHPLNSHRAKSGISQVTPRQGELTKAEFLTLYGECNQFLHKGSLKNLLKGNSPVQFTFPDITSKAQRLNDLLELHTVFMIGGDRLILCMLRNADDGGKVHAIEATRKTPPDSIKSALG